jgi:hypothetical protein
MVIVSIVIFFVYYPWWNRNKEFLILIAPGAVSLTGIILGGLVRKTKAGQIGLLLNLVAVGLGLLTTVIFLLIAFIVLFISFNT